MHQFCRNGSKCALHNLWNCLCYKNVITNFSYARDKRTIDFVGRYFVGRFSFNYPGYSILG